MPIARVPVPTARHRSPMLTYLCCYVGMLVLSLPFPALAQALQWRWLHCQMRCEAAWNPPPAPPTARQPAAQAALVSVTNGLGSAISALPSPVGRQAQPRSQAAWRGGEAATSSALGDAVRDVPRRAASGRHLGTSRPRYPGSSSGRPQRPRRGHPETRWELATRFPLVPTPPLRRTQGRVGPGVHPPPLWLPSHQTAPGGARPSSLPSAPPRPCLLDVGIRPPPMPSHRANRASSV